MATREGKREEETSLQERIAMKNFEYEIQPPSSYLTFGVKRDSRFRLAITIKAVVILDEQNSILNDATVSLFIHAITVGSLRFISKNIKILIGKLNIHFETYSQWKRLKYTSNI